MMLKYLLVYVNYFSFMPFCIGWVKNFDKIVLSCTVKGIEAKIQNGRHFWEEENFFKLPRVHCLDTLWVENFVEIILSRTVKEIVENLFFSHF